MEIKDLRINDFVYVKRPFGTTDEHYFKVSAIHKDEVCVQNQHGETYRNIDEISRIQFNEDILTLNGFVLDDDEFIYKLTLESKNIFRNYIEVFKMNDGDFCVICIFHINDNKANRVQMVINSVNEFQEVLRLSGFIDLADNIKL